MHLAIPSLGCPPFLLGWLLIYSFAACQDNQTSQPDFTGIRENIKKPTSSSIMIKILFHLISYDQWFIQGKKKAFEEKTALVHFEFEYCDKHMQPRKPKRHDKNHKHENKLLC